ncbi:MAG: hypothetical protein ABL971_02790 [Vicinamibacterales bacterium]
MRTRLGWKRHLILDACVVLFVVTRFVYPDTRWRAAADVLSGVAVLAVIGTLWRESNTAGPYTGRRGPFQTD